MTTEVRTSNLRDDPVQMFSGRVIETGIEPVLQIEEALSNSFDFRGINDERAYYKDWLIVPVRRRIGRQRNKVAGLVYVK
jgi:hypothetical protein